MSLTFADRLAAERLVVLDGGLATELERRGCDLQHELWSARVLEHAPEAIADVHLAYLRAGANCITTAAYQASVPGFCAAGHTAARAERLYRSSVRIAYEAQQAFCRERGMREDDAGAPLVAMSIGSYGAFLADGSEFRGGYTTDQADVRAFHGERLAVAVDELRRWADAPLLAFETVPSLDEAVMLAELLAEHPGASAWLSFSCCDGAHTCEGQRVDAAAERLAGFEQLAALGVNCTSPEHIAALVAEMSAAGKPVLVYPNAGGVYDAERKVWDGGGADGGGMPFARWVDAGARALGGCCRTTPEWIAGLAAFRRSLG